MIKIMKKLSLPAVSVALGFLLIQIFCNLYLPYLTADIVNLGILKGDIPYIWRQGGLMLVFALISFVAALINTYTSTKIANKLGGQLRSEIYSKVLTFSKREYDDFGAAGLITRNTTDVNQVQGLVSMFLKFLVLAPLYLVGGIILTYLLSPKLSLIFIAVIPLMFVIALVVYKFASPLYEKMQKQLDKLNLTFREGLTGVKIIRAFNKEEYEVNKYENNNQIYTDMAINAGTIMSVFMPFVTLLMNLTTIVIIWVGGHDIASGGTEIGTLIAVMNYAMQILLGFSLLATVILTVPKGQVSAKRIAEVMEKPLSIVETDNMTSQVLAGELSFKHVDFRYYGAAKKVLNDISFSVKAGETLAIVGGTGDGKSTLIELISRMYEVDSGSITIGGTVISSVVKEKLSQAVSITSQKAILFQGTIRSNLLRAKATATDAELWEVLENASAAEFVRKLSNGLDSPVEKAGGNFSGGQKQRLCIARTLLKEAEIYIFDDLFSALDFKTDLAIRTALKEKLKDKVTLIVAQRLNTIIDADCILVLDQGEVSGLGTHSELEATNHVYQEIIRSQVAKEDVA